MLARFAAAVGGSPGLLQTLKDRLAASLVEQRRREQERQDWLRRFVEVPDAKLDELKQTVADLPEDLQEKFFALSKYQMSVLVENAPDLRKALEAFEKIPVETRGQALSVATSAAAQKTFHKKFTELLRMFANV